MFNFNNNFVHLSSANFGPRPDLPDQLNCRPDKKPVNITARQVYRFLDRLICRQQVRSTDQFCRLM